MLKPLFSHSTQKHFAVVPSLHLALRWWLEVLSFGLHEEVPYCPETRVIIHLFCDARGNPPRVAAILFADGHVLYTDMEPPTSTLACFRSRKSNQTFSMILRGRRVRVWSDNTGNEASLRKGRARAFDRNALVVFLTRKAALDKLHLWVGRVPSELNIEILSWGIV